MGRAEDLFDRLERGGIAYLDELIETHKSEEAFLDFKRSQNNGQSTHLDGDDTKNLTRALAGFANSDGGVVIWGVKTGGGSSSGGADTASGKAPLRDCRAFAAAIDNAVSGRTNPPVPGVRSIPLPESDGCTGFVATLIPASSIGPHQTVDTKVYLARYGSSFQPVPHTVLAGMFGRRPQPKLHLEYLIQPLIVPAYGAGEAPGTVWAVITPMVVNAGGVVAKDVYFAWTITQLPTNSDAWASHGTEGRWQMDALDNRVGTCLALPDCRLAPFSRLKTMQITLRLRPPVDTGIKLVFNYGCDGAPPETVSFEASADTINKSLEAANDPSESRRHTACTRIFGMQPHW